MIEVRELTEDDAGWAEEVHEQTWGGTALVARLGELVDPRQLSGFVALLDGERVGLLNYNVQGDRMEVVTIVSLREGRGVGRALLDAARRRAQAAGCRRLWLVTTDNNLRALALYRLCGLQLVAFHHDGAARSRQVKPSIPARDQHGIPLTHELNLDLHLHTRPPSNP